VCIIYRYLVPNEGCVLFIRIFSYQVLASRPFQNREGKRCIVLTSATFPPFSQTFFLIACKWYMPSTYQMTFPYNSISLLKNWSVFAGSYQMIHQFPSRPSNLWISHVPANLIIDLSLVRHNVCPFCFTCSRQFKLIICNNWRLCTFMWRPEYNSFLYFKIWISLSRRQHLYMLWRDQDPLPSPAEYHRPRGGPSTSV
jgi:hypothetical protein